MSNLLLTFVNMFMFYIVKRRLGIGLTPPLVRENSPLFFRGNLRWSRKESHMECLWWSLRWSLVYVILGGVLEGVLRGVLGGVLGRREADLTLLSSVKDMLGPFTK